MAVVNDWREALDCLVIEMDKELSHIVPTTEDGTLIIKAISKALDELQKQIHINQ